MSLELGPLSMKRREMEDTVVCKREENGMWRGRARPPSGAFATVKTPSSVENFYYRYIYMYRTYIYTALFT
jgi:hypothetical protein